MVGNFVTREAGDFSHDMIEIMHGKYEVNWYGGKPQPKPSLHFII